MITKSVSPSITSYHGVNTDHDISGDNLPVAIVKTPEPTEDRIWVLDAIQYSYTGGVIDGGLTVRVGTNVKFDIDLASTEGSFSLYIPSQVDEDISVTLKSGGTGVIGKLNCQWHLEPA